MITLNKIIMSNEPPMSTDTVWVDVTAKPIIFKLWLKGQWTPIGDEMDEVADILARIDAFKKEYNTKVGELTAKDATHDDKITELESDVDDLQARMITAEGKITSLQSSVEALQSSVSSLQSDVSSLKTRVAALESPGS